MPKRKRGFTKEKYEKWIKEGRGTGVGSDYRPWLTIQNVASRGRSTRMKGITTKRQHEFLSDMERNYFVIVEFSKEVKDIREQFPLLPLEQTLAIAKEIGVKHPTDPSTNEPIVMTTDFLITVEKNGVLINLARTIKPKDELNSKRQIEKFEIERIFWKQAAVDWGIVTDSEIDKTFAQNVLNVYKYYEIADTLGFTSLTIPQINKLINEFVLRLNCDQSVREVSDRFDEEMILTPGSGLALFKHLVIHRIIEIDMFRRMDVDNPIEIRINKDMKKIGDKVI